MASQQIEHHGKRNSGKKLPSSYTLYLGPVLANHARNNRELVDKHELVYIPESGDDGDAWVRRSDCLLDAPRTLRHKYPIVARYRAAFPRVDLTLLTQFFQNQLGIAKYSWKDTIREIQYLNNKDYPDFDLINAQYVSLNKARRDWVTTGINAEMMR